MQDPRMLSAPQLIAQIQQLKTAAVLGSMPAPDLYSAPWYNWATKPRTVMRLGRYGYGVRTYGLRNGRAVLPHYVSYDEIVWC